MKNKFKILNVAAVALLCFAGSSFGQSGTLDLTFNSTGKVLSGIKDVNNDVKIQSDGKIITVGTTSPDGSTPPKLRVTRLLPTGALDPNFGTAGVFTYLSGNEAAAYDCHILPSGKILVVGYSYLYSASQNIVVLQLLANGTLDVTGFGTGGVVTLDPGLEDNAYGVTVLANGSILIAGETSAIVGVEEVRYATITKLSAAGVVDNSFGVSGYAKVNAFVPATGEGKGGSKFHDIKVQSDGKILGIGQQGFSIGSNYAALIARFTATGTLDSYGTAGKVVKNINGLYDSFMDAELLSNNDLVVSGITAITAGNAAYKMILLKYNINGQPVAGFGTNGQVTVDPSPTGTSEMTSGNTLAIQSDGKIIVGGACNQVAISNQNFGVWRRNADGSADASFGTNGLAAFDFSAGLTGRDEAAGMALQSDGKIVLVGGSWNGNPAKLSATTIRLNNTITPPVGLTLSLTALLEGFYNGSTMVTDVVTVELHNSTSPYALVTSKTGVSLNSAGTGTVNFTGGASGVNYYIVVKHKNSIETWSAPAMFTSNALTYNFTTAANKAYGSNMKLKSGKWCIFSGDVNQDGTVDLNDMTPIDNDAFNFVSGPNLLTDLNGDGTVDLNDMTLVDNNAFNFISLVRP